MRSRQQQTVVDQAYPVVDLHRYGHDAVVVNSCTGKKRVPVDHLHVLDTAAIVGTDASLRLGDEIGDRRRVS